MLILVCFDRVIFLILFLAKILFILLFLKKERNTTTKKLHLQKKITNEPE